MLFALGHQKLLHWPGYRSRGSPPLGSLLSRRHIVKHCVQAIISKLLTEIQSLDMRYQTQMLYRILAHESPALLRHLHKGITIPYTVDRMRISSRNR